MPDFNSRRVIKHEGVSVLSWLIRQGMLGSTPNWDWRFEGRAFKWIVVSRGARQRFQIFLVNPIETSFLRNDLVAFDWFICSNKQCLNYYNTEKA